MSDFYDELQATAIELIEEFGGDAKLQSGTLTDKGSVKAVSMSQEHMTLAGFTVSVKTRGFYISPESKVKPEPGDILSFQKKVYTLKETKDMTPNFSQTMYYMATGS